MSLNSVGRICFSASRMPSDSSWKTPTESPRESISKVLASSSGIDSISTSSPRERRMMSTASSITSRLRSPRKSIFSRPISSIGFIEYWVTILYWRAGLPFGPFSAGAPRSSASCSGTISSSGRSAITTAAAWIELLRTIPSSPRATSTIWRVSPSAS